MSSIAVLTENQKKRIKRQVCALLPVTIASSHFLVLLVHVLLHKPCYASSESRVN
jgi:hypothetical protein